MFKKIKRYAKDPYYSFGYYIIKKHPKWMTDRFYIKVLWRMLMGYKLNLKSPQTFNEKLQWLKLYDRNPLYPTLVDKYRVKQWVADRIGEEYVIPSLAVYKSVDEIDLGGLPDQFVLKCNHDSGSVAICLDKESFDLEAVKLKLSRALKNNFYWDAREWAYKNINRLVFAEKYMVDTLQGVINQLKGVPDLACIMLCKISKMISTPASQSSMKWSRPATHGQNSLKAVEDYAGI